jgi:molybdopterin converting factor small subunit
VSCTAESETTGSDTTSHIIVVRFLGFLQRLAGQRETSVEIQSETTVLDLLNTLTKRYGEDFSSAIFRAPGEVQTYLSIFLDDEEVSVSDPIRADQSRARKVELLILPIFEGGSQ